MKPPISTKKCHERAWNWIKEKMFYDLTLNIFSTIWLLIDISSDIEAGREHWRNEHYHWAISTWAFMFVPFLICFALEIILHQCIDSMERLKEVLWKLSGHMPLCQIFYHFKVLWDVNRERKNMQEKRDYYNKINYDEFKEEKKDELIVNANEFVKAKEKYSKCLSDLQDQKLFEGFGESAPQACLQISIVLVQGKCSFTILRAIITSFITLTKCAVCSFLTMSTKEKEIKEASWKTKLFFALPCMLFVVTPRLITLSILATYLKGWISMVVFLMITVNYLSNQRFLWRDQEDPKKVTLGCFANIFAPVVVVEDSSAFFLRSSLISTLLYIISLIILVIAVLCGELDSTPMLTPCNTTQPSIFHCFDDGGIHENYTVLRCPLTLKG